MKKKNNKTFLLIQNLIHSSLFDRGFPPNLQLKIRNYFQSE